MSNTLDVNDPLIDALIMQESSGDPNAVSSAGAKGLTQLLDSTFADYAKPGQDIFDPDANREVGTKHLNRLLDKYEGNTELALTAYNWGEGNLDKAIRKTGSTDLDELEQVIPRGAQPGYARQVLSKLQEGETPNVPKQSRRNSKVSTFNSSPFQEDEEEIATPKYTLGQTDRNDRKGLYEVLAPAMLGGGPYNSLSLEEQLNLLNEVAISKPWDEDTKQAIKDFGSIAYEYAPIDQQFKFEDLVGTPPITPPDADPVKATQQWSAQVVSDLRRDGVSPLIYGKYLDDYLEQASQAEIQAHEIRNRGMVGEATNWLSGAASSLMKGALQNISEPAAGITRLATGGSEQGQATADWIESLPNNLVYTPDLDYLYETDENGKLYIDPQTGAPVTKASAFWMEGIGEVAGALVGGIGFKGVGLLAKGAGKLATGRFIDKAVDVGLVTTDALAAGNESFKIVYDATGGDTASAYTSALWSMGTSALTEGVTDMAIVSKIGSPGAAALSNYNKGVYVGKHVLQSATLGATGNAAADALAQAGEMAVAGTEFSAERLGYQAAFGGIGGGVAGAVTGVVGARREEPQVAPPPPPEVEGPITDTGVPPQQEAPKRPAKTIVRGPESTETVPYAPTTPEEQVTATQLAEGFQNSWEPVATMSIEQARNLDPAVRETLGIRILPSGESNGIVVVEKENSYGEVTPADTVEGIDQQIQKIQKDLQDNPSKEELGSGKVGDDLRALKTELKALIEERAATNETQAARQAQAVDIFNRREAAIKRLESLQQERKINKDPDIRIILGEDIRAARQDVDAIDAEWLALDNEEQRIAELTTKIKDIQNKITAATTPGVRGKSLYANNRSLQNGNLAKLFNERKKRIVAQNEPNLQSVYNGFEIGGFRVMPYNGKWYAFNPVTEETSRGFADYKDLLETIDARSRGETVSKQFVTRVDTEPKPVRAERPAAKVEVKAEPKKRGRPRKTEVRREVPPMPEGDTGVDLNDVLLTTGGAARRGEAEPRKEAEPRVEEARERVQGTRPNRGYSILTPKESYQKQNYTAPVEFTLQGTDPVTYKDIFNRAANIVRALNKSFVALTNTRLPRGVLGVYNGVKRFASVGKIDDISTFMHEAIGHAIDASIITKWNTRTNDYNDIDQTTYEGLVETAQDWYPDSISEPQTLVREGFAIFFQNYMTGQPVHKDVLNWYQNKFKELHPEVYKELESLKDLTFKYLDASPAVHALNNRVGEKATKLPRKPFSYYYNFVKDKFISESAVLGTLDDIMGSNLKALRNTNMARALGLADNLVSKGLVDLSNNKLIGMSLKEAVAPAKGAEQQLMLYLYLNNSLTMNKEGKDSGMSTPELERGLADFNQQASEANTNKEERRKFQGAIKAAQNLYKLNTQFLLMLRNTSPDAQVYVDNLIKKNWELTGTVHGYYAPRQVAGKGKFDSTKKRTGTSRAVSNPINLYKAAYQKWYESALMSQEKQALVESAALSNGSLVSTYIREIKGKNTPLLKIYKDKLSELLKREPTAEDMLDAPFELPGFEAPAYQQVESNGILTYHDGNSLRFFEVDPRLLKAYGSPLPQVMNSAPIKLIKLSTQTLRQGATTFRPIFQLWELIRTPMAVARYLDADQFGSAKAVLNVYYNMLYTIPDVIGYNLGRRNNGLAAVIGRMGILSSPQEVATRSLSSTLTEGVVGNTLNKVLDGLSKTASALSVVDQSARLAAVRIIAKERGIIDFNKELSIPDQVALANAYRISGTNFIDQGSWARVANTFIPFFSARIAELARVPGDFRRNPKNLSAYFIAASLYGLYHAISNKDDEGLREMSDVERFKFINLPITVDGVKSYLKIPLDTVTQMAFAMGTIFGRKAAEKEDMPVSLLSMASSYIGEFAPVSSIEQALLSPFGQFGVAVGQQVFNKNFYFDKAVVPTGLKYFPPAEQYTEYTTELAKSVGALTKQSPMRIEQGIKDIFPAALEYIRGAEALTGIKKQTKEDRSGNFLTAALVRAGSAESIVEQSRKAFENNLEKYQATKYSGDPQADEVRKYLERLNKDISNLNVIIRGTGDQELKDKLRVKRRELYREGARVSEDNFRPLVTGRYQYQADIMRKKEKAEREARRKKKD